MSMMKHFPFLLTFFYQLVLREGIFESVAYLILSFFCNKLKNRLYSSNNLQTGAIAANFFFVFVMILNYDSEHQNINKGCEETFTFIIHKVMKSSSELKKEIFQKKIFFQKAAVLKNKSV